jgi:plasmid stabilization system protein ParE
VTSRCRLSARAEAGYQGALLQAQEQFGLEVAERVRAELLHALDRLAEFPDIGHQRPDLTYDPTMRFWSVGPTLIAYRPSLDGIEIFLVERAERDWGHLLEEEEE